jgi:hypothetical protein
MIWESDLTRDIRDGYGTMAWEDYIFENPNRYHGLVEVTDCNRQAVKNYFNKVQPFCKAILEIGICRNDKDSITHTFINNKLNTTTYIGIDIEDKSFLNNTSKNIFTLKTNSHDYEKNEIEIKKLGVTEFDFIFIDGRHSIDDVLHDWEYTRMLSKNGIVGFHDINWHAGPYEFINALRTDKWHIEKNICPDDWGIAFVWRK